MLKIRDITFLTQYNFDQYDPDLEMTVLDAILDGGAPPPHAMDRQLVILHEWYPVVFIIALLCLIGLFIWNWRYDHKGSRPW